MVALGPVIDFSLTNFNGENRVSIVIRMDEKCLKVGQLDFDFNQEVRLIKTALVFQLLDICFIIARCL